jgi:purine-cytosine permease-like protein
LLGKSSFLVATPLYTGPIAAAMGGVDLSWIVGLQVTSPAYYWLARLAQAAGDARLAAAQQVGA